MNDDDSEATQAARASDRERPRMHRIGRAGLVMLLAMLAALPGGCGFGGPPAPPGGPEVFRNIALEEVGSVYGSYLVDAKKPPTKVADVAKYENGLPAGYRELKNGNLKVYWGAPLSDSATDTVLAYEKATPESGGYVLMQDGKTVRKMTAAEFQAAPKAGRKEAAKAK